MRPRTKKILKRAGAGLLGLGLGGLIAVNTPFVRIGERSQPMLRSSARTAIVLLRPEMPEKEIDERVRKIRFAKPSLATRWSGEVGNVVLPLGYRFGTIELGDEFPSWVAHELP